MVLSDSGALVPSARLRPPRRLTWEALLAIKPPEPLVIDVRPFAIEQQVQAAIAEPAPCRGKLAQGRAKSNIIGPRNRTQLRSAPRVRHARR
jgi:hypothetical protein